MKSNRVLHGGPQESGGAPGMGIWQDFSCGDSFRIRGVLKYIELLTVGDFILPLYQQLGKLVILEACLGLPSAMENWAGSHKEKQISLDRGTRCDEKL